MNGRADKTNHSLFLGFVWSMFQSQGSNLQSLKLNVDVLVWNEVHRELYNRKGRSWLWLSRRSWCREFRLVALPSIRVRPMTAYWPKAWLGWEERRRQPVLPTWLGGSRRWERMLSCRAWWGLLPRTYLNIFQISIINRTFINESDPNRLIASLNLRLFDSIPIPHLIQNDFPK